MMTVDTLGGDNDNMTIEAIPSLDSDKQSWPSLDNSSSINKLSSWGSISEDKKGEGLHSMDLTDFIPPSYIQHFVHTCETVIDNAMNYDYESTKVSTKFSSYDDDSMGRELTNLSLIEQELQRELNAIESSFNFNNNYAECIWNDDDDILSKISILEDDQTISTFADDEKDVEGVIALEEILESRDYEDDQTLSTFADDEEIQYEDHLEINVKSEINKETKESSVLPCHQELHPVHGLSLTESEEPTRTESEISEENNNLSALRRNDEVESLAFASEVQTRCGEVPTKHDENRSVHSNNVNVMLLCEEPTPRARPGKRRESPRSDTLGPKISEEVDKYEQVQEVVSPIKLNVPEEETSRIEKLNGLDQAAKQTICSSEGSNDENNECTTNNTNMKQDIEPRERERDAKNRKTFFADDKALDTGRSCGQLVINRQTFFPDESPVEEEQQKCSTLADFMKSSNVLLSEPIEIQPNKVDNVFETSSRVMESDQPLKKLPENFDLLDNSIVISPVHKDLIAMLSGETLSDAEESEIDGTSNLFCRLDQREAMVDKANFLENKSFTAPWKSSRTSPESFEIDTNENETKSQAFQHALPKHDISNEGKSRRIPVEESEKSFPLQQLLNKSFDISREERLHLLMIDRPMNTSSDEIDVQEVYNNTDHLLCSYDSDEVGPKNGKSDQNEEINLDEEVSQPKDSCKLETASQKNCRVVLSVLTENRDDNSPSIRCDQNIKGSRSFPASITLSEEDKQNYPSPSDFNVAHSTESNSDDSNIVRENSEEYLDQLTWSMSPIINSFSDDSERTADFKDRLSALRSNEVFSDTNNKSSEIPVDPIKVNDTIIQSDDDTIDVDSDEVSRISTDESTYNESEQSCSTCLVSSAEEVETVLISKSHWHAVPSPDIEGVETVLLSGTETFMLAESTCNTGRNEVLPNVDEQPLKIASDASDGHGNDTKSKSDCCDPLSNMFCTFADIANVCWKDRKSDKKQNNEMPDMITLSQLDQHPLKSVSSLSNKTQEGSNLGHCTPISDTLRTVADIGNVLWNSCQQQKHNATTTFSLTRKSDTAYGSIDEHHPLKRGTTKRSNTSFIDGLTPKASNTSSFDGGSSSSSKSTFDTTPGLFWTFLDIGEILCKDLTKSSQQSTTTT